MADSKKILIVSYYWFPFSGTGVYRVSRIAKYLKRAGWEPIILTTRNAAALLKEQSHAEEFKNLQIHRTKSFEPENLLRFFKKTNSSAGSVSHFIPESRGVLSRFILWTRLNLFIPDAKIGWKSSAIKQGLKIIENESPLAIFSTSPPTTTQLIAKALAEKSGLPWIADFRDPWTRVFYLDYVNRAKWAQKIHEKLERSVLEHADRIVVVSKGFFDLKAIEHKTVFIPNGYDPDERSLVVDPVKKNDKFTIRYMGSYKLNQLTSNFFKALSELASSGEFTSQIRFEVYGSINEKIRHAIEAIGIETNFTPFVNHDKMIQLCSTSDLLLLAIGQSRREKGIASTKLFEYILAGKPILGIGNTEGIAAEIVKETNTGSFFNYSDGAGTFQFLKEHYNAWLMNDPAYAPDLDKVKFYSFERLTDTLIGEIKAAIKEKQNNDRQDISTRATHR